MKEFLTTSYVKTAEITKEALTKVDQRIKDPALQNNIREIGVY